MNIRTRLLCLLLPPLITLITLISLFFYYNWYNEIMTGHNAADMIDTKLHNAILVIVSSASATILMVIISTIVIANKISAPIQKLKDSALAIAAGNYEENILSEGPQEVAELANTLNTMSECLCDTISRLRESSAARERMYGEYECSLLLQHHMLQKNVDNFQHDKLSLRLLKGVTTTAPLGTLLNIEGGKHPEDITFTLKEAEENGFSGIYKLLKGEGAKDPTIQLTIADQCSTVTSTSKGMPKAMLWCAVSKTLSTFDKSTHPFHKGDLVILYNNGLEKQFGSKEAIIEWFSKVLRHFATDGIDSTQSMLSHELNFLANKQQIDHDIYILILGNT